MASVSATRAVLEAHGLTTKYSLGQNFLVNDAILKKIIALSEISSADDVLEVGPGIGTLTAALLPCANRVASVECDPDLPAVLAQTLAPWADRFTLIEKDALDVRREDIPFAPDKFIANLPYAVAATVVLDYFERMPSLQSATVMVQKEVADRMMSCPGSKNYGAYTVKLRLYAQPKGRFAVGPGNFFPPPRVESAVVRLDRRPVFDNAGNALPASVLKAAAVMADAAFATRRKTLANSCKAYFTNSFKTCLGGRDVSGAHIAVRLPELFVRADVDACRRGEALDMPEFISLGQALLSII